MSLESQLKIAGVSMWLLVAAHLHFVRVFGWTDDIEKLSLLNRRVFEAHCFFIVLILGMFGSLSVEWTRLLLQPSPLARVVLCGLVVFWTARLAIQILVFDAAMTASRLFNVPTRLGACLCWAYYAALYAIALRRQFP